MKVAKGYTFETSPLTSTIDSNRFLFLDVNIFGNVNINHLAVSSSNEVNTDIITNTNYAENPIISTNKKKKVI